jgi:outer membrane receptor protein involved in Fe transport
LQLNGGTRILVALAGVAAAGVASPPVRADTAVLGEVIVLAQKRGMDLDRLASPVAAYSGAELEAAGIRDIRGLAARSPMLDYQESVTAATATLRIRRVGNIGNIPTFEPAVGYFEDGAFRSRSLFSAADLLDVERIEVLRGPQTTLYGKNTGAGVVALYTRAPGEAVRGGVEATGGMLDTRGSPALAGIRAALDGPIAGDLRGGLAVGGAWHGDTLGNGLPGGPGGNALARASARAQLAYAPTERLSLRLVAGAVRQDSDEGESDTVFTPGAGSTSILEALQAAGLADQCPGDRPRDRRVCSVATNHLDLEAATATLLAEYRLDNGWSLHSITGYERYDDHRDEDDAMQLLTPLLFFHDSEDGKAWQQELRLASADGATAPWLAGVFWYRYRHERGMHGGRPMFGPNGDAAFDPLWEATLGIPLALPGQLGLHDSRQHAEYVAAYGQLTVPMGSRFDVTGAARAARETRTASIENAVSAPGRSLVSESLTPAASPTGAAVNGVIDRASESVTWSLTPRLQLGGNRILYATWARGGKFGGFNTGFGNAPLAAREFGDETIDHLEAGGRLRFADGRGRLAASAFRTRYYDYQDAAFASAQFSIGNAERADLDGFEVEVEYLAGAGTHASLSVSYADFRYGRNTTGMCYPGRTPDGSMPGACNLAGEHPVDAPPWSAWLGLEQPFALGALPASARVDWNWTDRYNTSFSADPRLVQDAFHDVALRLAVQVAHGVRLELAGENLLGETVAMTEPVLNFFDDASWQTYYDAPRRILLTLRAEF